MRVKRWSKNYVGNSAKMPRKRRVSATTLDMDEEDFGSEVKYNKEDVEGRAPRNAANARERARMRVLSKAFCRLKTTLPWVPADTKLSKLDTLRLAATYIAHLRAVLRDDGETYPDTTRSLSLTLSWPFTMQNATTPMLMNNSCNVSSTSVSSPNPTQYRNQQSPYDMHGYDQTFHHQNTSAHQTHESQLSYY